jgi:Iap family predicted aminopeptidase
VVPGANDNASGVATAISLADELERDPAENVDVWVVLTGAEECLMQGMRSFLRAHRKTLEPDRTYVINLDSVGRGDVRFVTGEGLAVTYELESRLTELASAVAEADAAEEETSAKPLRHGFATDALPAQLRRIPATTITCLEPRALVPANYHSQRDIPKALDPEAMRRAHDFALSLIRLLDREAGRRPRATDAEAPVLADRG